MTIKRTERGWAGHFICGDKCRYHRNTLLTSEDGRHIVVSTVGNMVDPLRREPMCDLGFQRHYETMAFIAGQRNTGDHYIEMLPGHDIGFSSQWAIQYTDENKDYVDNLADKMHDDVVEELSENFDKRYVLAMAEYVAGHADSE